ncbi:MAG: hypothetical protein RJA22_979 [Verrucomicrobiota bacterium]|jgi:hypothetical protein
MPASRRQQSGAVRLVPAVKAVLLCTLIGGLCVGYVLQKNQIYELGQQKGQREARLKRLRQENQLLSDRLAAMQLPHRLAERVATLRLGLLPPQPSQVIWMTETPAIVRATNHAGRFYVQQGRKGPVPAPTP